MQPRRFLFHRFPFWQSIFILLTLSMIALLAIIPARSATQTQLVLANTSGTRALPANLRILEYYEAFVLAEATTTDLRALEQDYVVDFLPERTVISLNGTTFDTSQGEPKLSADLRSAPEDPYFLIQFYGPTKAEWLKELESMGVAFLGYHPNFTFIVRMDPALLPKVQQAHAVQWVGPYHPAYRLASAQELQLAFAQDGLIALNLRSFPGQDPTALQEKVAGVGASIEWVASRELQVMRIWATPEQIPALAAIPGVYRLEPYIPPTFDNERASQVTRTWDVRSASRNGLLQDLTGEGQIAGMVDSGLDANNTTPNINDFYDFTNGIKTSRISAALPGQGCSSPCFCYNSDSENASGHGTHVAGTILGNGYNSLLQRGLQNQARGANPFFDYAFGVGQAPEARMVFSYVAGHYYLTQGTLCGLGDVYLTWKSVYDNGARNVNNSWGAPYYSYGQDATEADEIMWDYQDYLVLASARNDGPNWNTVGQPGTAKNILSVGASGNHRSLWNSSDTAVVLTDFSSRGPVNPPSDGRFKPDIVAPGADILSTRTTFIDEDTFTLWSNEPGDGNGDGHMDYWWSGGTSMSAPNATGAATIVRDYLQDIQWLGSSTPPSAALVKAFLLNGAVDTGYGYENLTTAPYGGRNMQGWGMVNLEQSITPRAPRSFFYDDFTNITAGQKTSSIGFTTSGSTRQYTFNVIDSNEPLKITLTWTDRQLGSDGYAVNNLDLLVTAPGGMQYRGNVFNGSWSTTGGSADAKNNTEAVYVQNPPAGQWTLQTIATTINSSTQPYALVVSGGLGVTPSYTRSDPSGRAGTSSQPYFPSLRPLSGTQEHTAPGSAFTTSVRLTNWGTNADTFSLSYAVTNMNGVSASGITVTYNPSGPIALASGASQDVQVTVKVALGASSGAYDVALTAASAGAGSRKDAQVLGLNVLTPSSLLNETHIIADSAPQFAPDAWGSGQTLWITYLTAENHNNSEAKIWTARSTNGGQTWSKMGQVDANDGAYYAFPVIAGKADGSSVTVAWHRSDSTAMYARTWTNGSGWGAIQTLATYNNDETLYEPDVIYDNNGDILVVWFAYRGTNYTSGVYSAQSTNNGASWTTVAAIPDATGTNAPSRYAQLTLDTARNDVWMAYSHRVLDYNRDVRLKRWDGDSNAWDAAGVRNITVAGTGERESRPAVAYIAATDSLWVSWHRYVDYSNPTPRLYYTRSTGSLPNPSFPVTYGPFIERIAEQNANMITGDGSYTYISYLAYKDSLRGANVYLLRIPAAGGAPNLTYQSTATVDDPPFNASGNAGAPRLLWLNTTLNGFNFTGPTLLYSKNPPDSQNPSYGSLGFAQTLFNLSENFDLYLAQARSFIAADTYADPDGLCAGNTPCYTSLQIAINEVRTGGSVHVYPKVFNEAVSLSKNATVQVLGSATISSLSISDGVFNAPAGTLTLTGNLYLNGGSFNPGSSTVAFAGSSPQWIGGSPPAAFNHLTINNISGVALGQPVNINGNLTLSNGLLTLGKYNLTLGAASSVAGSPSAANMVIATDSGELRKTFSGTGSFTFPIGDSDGIAEYSPVTLNFTSGSFNNAYAGVRLVDTAHPLNPTSSDYLTRYWEISQNGISGFSCTAAFNYLPADVVGVEANLSGKQYDGVWWSMLNPVDALNHRISAVLTSFSAFTAGLDEPDIVRLADFSLTSSLDQVTLSWETSQETGLDGFNVYRSTSLDGLLTKLNGDDLIPATGAGTLYSFEDDSGTIGLVYYYWIEVVSGGVAQYFGPLAGARFNSLFLPAIQQPQP
ncbi:MAG: S8 family serine peptidase [Anaerolineales bacterium]|nr:S8 family serine peptidase [Anaerolineales bacterium]